MRTGALRYHPWSGMTLLLGALLGGCGSSPTQPGVPDHLVFAVQPTLTPGSRPITPAVQVAIVDRSGNIVTSATDTVNVAIGTNPAGGTLLGTLRAKAASGIASFGDLSIDRPGAGYTLTATSGALAGSSSVRFDIVLAFAAISAGTNSACGVSTAGAAYCWGDNGYGELGDGTTTPSPRPVAVVGSLTFASVSTGAVFACGVTTQGAAYCWGLNNRGQLGNATTTNSATPVPVAGGLTFATVSAAAGWTCGVTTSDAAYCWGAGPLGNGLATRDSIPVPVAGGLRFTRISGGGLEGTGPVGSTCGVTTQGDAYCWGDNYRGELGIGTPGGDSLTPVLVTGRLTFATVRVGTYFACGVTPSGAAYCWGYNLQGQLGTGSLTGPVQCSPGTPCSTSPVAVTGGLVFSAVSGGTYSTCGVTTTGAAYCWGNDLFGQLGNGTITNTNTPTPVAVAGGLSFTAVSAGIVSACGIATTSAAYCWGDNRYGQLGNGTTGVGSPVPVPVAP